MDNQGLYMAIYCLATLSFLAFIFYQSARTHKKQDALRAQGICPYCLEGAADCLCPRDE